MATQLQLRKGTKIQNDAFTGAEAELTYDTTSKGLRIHDGETQGGHEVPVLVAVQRPTAENNYTWFRKWSDGWVEQGGSQKFTAAQTVYTTVNLPVEMANSDYTLVSQPGYTIITGTNKGQHVASRNGLKTTTTIFIAAYGAGSTDLTDYIDWQVSGMAA